MNDAEKQIAIIKLYKLQNVLEERISLVSFEIEKQIVLIKENKIQLESITLDMNKNEEEFNDLRKKNYSLRVELEGLESQFRDYVSEIQNAKKEIDEAKSKINAQKPKDDFWSNLNRGMNVFTGDIPGWLSNNITELENKIKNLDDEIYNKSKNIGDLQIKKGECDSDITMNEKKTEELREKRIYLEESRRELGRIKTKNEDFKLELEQLKSQCKLLLENIDDGKELLEIGINSVNEIEERAKNLFSVNSLTLTF